MSSLACRSGLGWRRVVRTFPPFYRTSLGCRILLSSVVEPAAVITITADWALTPPLPHAARSPALVMSTSRGFIVVRIPPTSAPMVR